MNEFEKKQFENNLLKLEKFDVKFSIIEMPSYFEFGDDYRSWILIVKNTTPFAFKIREDSVSYDIIPESAALHIEDISDDSEAIMNRFVDIDGKFVDNNLWASLEERLESLNLEGQIGASIFDKLIYTLVYWPEEDSVGF